MRLWGWSLTLAAVAALSACAARGEPADGDWNGAITTPAAALHVAVHIKPGPGGALKATLDSPDQGIGGIPSGEVAATAATLAFTVPAVAGAYDGKWDQAAHRWVGTWTQGDHPLPLDLARGSPPRPVSTCAKTPRGPWPSWCDILIWTPSEQQAAYADMDKVFPVHVVHRGATRRDLPVSERPLPVSFQVDGETWTTADFLRRTHASGVLVIQGGAIRLETYQDNTPPPFDRRWPGFSVTKSVTSILVGAAIRDGGITGLDAPVTDYLPELKASAYDGVTVRQLITMTSGVRWNENYGDPKADIANYDRTPGPAGENAVLAYMAKLPRDAPPGTRFHYSTGEATLAGMVVARATHKNLAEYLSEKIWAPAGMERDAAWVLGHSDGQEAGGWGLAMTLRDEGRLGLFMLGGGVIDGKPVLPDSWIADATANHNPGSPPGPGYGYYWWIRPGGYSAVGVFGQTMYINPAAHLIVVIQSAWPFASDAEDGAAQTAFLKAIYAAATQLQPLK